MDEISIAPGLNSMEFFPARIEMPYTLTPGRAVGVYLAELGNARLIGSRHGETVHLPAQDYSVATGEPIDDFVEVAPTGTIESFTEVGDDILAFIHLDGVDGSLTHRLLSFDSGRPRVGDRVEAVWAVERSGVAGDLLGFQPLDAAESFAPHVVEPLAEPIEQVDYSMTLEYQHAYGYYYGTLFDGVKHDRRIRGVKCSKCERVLLPPRAMCDVCYAPTLQWVDVDPVGTVQASSVVHIEFIGQRLKPPYVYAEIVLDGTNTRLIHMIGDIDPELAKTKAAPGARVQAVWSERRTGSLADIDYFEVVDA